MNRKIICTLLVLSLTFSSIPLFYQEIMNIETRSEDTKLVPLDYNYLSEIYGEEIPVVMRFRDGLTPALLDIINGLGLEFSLGSSTMSHIGQYYLLEGSSTSLSALVDTNFVLEIAPQTHMQYLESTRDVSMAEINADDVWGLLDDYGRNITGKDMLIADLDTGVDWRHPDLWFADGGNFTYVNATGTGFLNGTDGVDLNNDYALEPGETLYALDLNKNGIYDVSTEWLWADNVTQNGIPDVGEPFFVVNDTNHNGQLDGFEDLIMLKTPKTKYIFENDGAGSPHLQSWVRGENLTSSTHTDDSPYGGGHGTGVAGILLGGQLGYRKYVGVAPDAELMMIRVIGDPNTWLTIEEGLAIANSTGADVILTEIGSWTYEYLDGSSVVEDLINDLVTSGIPVISPSGNLGGKMKHAMLTVTPGTPYPLDFAIPPPDYEYVFEDISNVYITVLSVNSTDFSSCNFQLIMNQSSFGQAPAIFDLTPGIGYLNFFAEPPTPYYTVESFISTSVRGTSMLGIWIHGILPVTTAPFWHRLNITSPDPTLFHAYISDDQSSWTGGCTWMSDVVDLYEICWPSTADLTISVASYRTRNLVGGGVIGEIAGFSSRGPRIDDVLKQGVAAPGGYDIISDYAYGSTWSWWFNANGVLPFDQQFGSYRLFSGTSASGPHVAGCAALLLQANSSIGSQIPQIIENTAREDTYTGSTPSYTWGSGKLDVEAAIHVLVDDISGPVIETPLLSPSTNIYNTTDVTVSVVVTDISGVDSVTLIYDTISMIPTNVTMVWTGFAYEGVIPAFPTDTIVQYWIVANDTLGNSAFVGPFSYTVQEQTTTTTTTTTSTTTTTTTTGTEPTGPTETNPDLLRLALLLSGVLVLAIICFAVSRRRSK